MSDQRKCHRCGHALCDHVKPGCGPFREGQCAWMGCRCELSAEEIAKAPRAATQFHDGVQWGIRTIANYVMGDRDR